MKRNMGEDHRANAADARVNDQGNGKTKPKARLAIKNMVLENFKSYAGKQHVGPFHKVRRWNEHTHTRARTMCTFMSVDTERCERECGV